MNLLPKEGEKRTKERSDIFGIHYTTQQTVHFYGIWRCNLHVYVTYGSYIDLHFCYIDSLYVLIKHMTLNGMGLL